MTRTSSLHDSTDSSDRQIKDVRRRRGIRRRESVKLGTGRESIQGIEEKSQVEGVEDENQIEGVQEWSQVVGVLPQELQGKGEEEEIKDYHLAGQKWLLQLELEIIS